MLAGQALTRYYTDKAYQQFNRDLAYNLLAERRLISDGRLDREALKRTFDLYMTINPSIEIYLLDLDGNILAYSAEPSQVKRSRVDLQPVRAFLAGQELPLLGDDPRSHDRRKSFSVTPVPPGDAAEGYLYVVLRGETYDAFERLHQDSLLLRLSLVTLAGSLACGLLAGLWIFYLLTRRLRRLAAAMADFRASRFRRYRPYPLPAGTDGDEIDRLGGSFNRMAQRMQALLTALERQDRLRRELINNVSHDLRTPLTCLHGYLQTLALKRDRLDAAEREECLQMALRHSERLGRLIDELFELARLDARAVTPNREPFPIAELLHDVAQKFRLAARQRGVTLQVDAPPDGGLWVLADLGLLERVLENLLTNALEHTPPAGTIRLALHRGRERPREPGADPGAGPVSREVARIDVADSGSGIAAEDLPFVFERCYRGRHAPTAGRDHAGLGLAIAERIVALHDGRLGVSSEPGRGACFSVSLPLLPVRRHGAAAPGRTLC